MTETGDRIEMSEKRTFTKQELYDLDLPGGDAVVSDEISDTGRWSIHHRLVFRVDGQPEDEAWCVYYSVGASDSQDEQPWENDDEVEATLVRRTEKLVTVWE